MESGSSLEKKYFYGDIFSIREKGLKGTVIFGIRDFGAGWKGIGRVNRIGKGNYVNWDELVGIKGTKEKGGPRSTLFYKCNTG